MVQLSAIAAFCGRGGRTRRTTSREPAGSRTLTFADAAKIGEPLVVKALIEEKADFYATDENGRNAAHLARSAETFWSWS